MSTTSSHPKNRTPRIDRVADRHSPPCSNQELKQRLLAFEGAYNANSVVAIDGFLHLFAIRKVGKGKAATTSGVFLFDGNFSRAQYKKAVDEARTAGICHAKMYVYCSLAPYSGRGIMVTKFSELPESVLQMREAPHIASKRKQGFTMKKFEVGTIGFSVGLVEIHPGKPGKMWRLSIEENGLFAPTGTYLGNTPETIEQYMRDLFEAKGRNIAIFRNLLDLRVSERDPAVPDADYLRASQALSANPDLKIYCTDGHGRIFLPTREIMRDAVPEIYLPTRRDVVPEIYLGVAPAEIVNDAYHKTPYHVQKAALVQHVHARAAEINQMAEADDETHSCDRPAP